MKRGKSKTSLKNSKNTKIVLGIFALIFISTVFAYTIINTPASGYRVIKKGGSQEINVHSITCKNVTNKNLAYDIFVPTNQSEEWNRFLSRKPSYVSVIDCDGSICTPDCAGKICGSDGCDGTCGSCPTGKICNNFGTACITQTCTPDCFGALCGADDGCGGKCVGEEGICGYLEKCSTEGVCEKICSSDCVPGCSECCGNDVCDWNEDYDSCSLDCPMTCIDCLHQCDILYCDSISSGDICYGGIGTNCAEMCGYCQIQCIENFQPPC
ncbi:MAG TPA: hypothetical protein PLK34_02580 [Candidatus Pacearchaeota archaeon]|nr:hypothetical protein [Candidatus Pacearchaeota archaeon]